MYLGGFCALTWELRAAPVRQNPAPAPPASHPNPPPSPRLTRRRVLATGYLGAIFYQDTQHNDWTDGLQHREIYWTDSTIKNSQNKKVVATIRRAPPKDRTIPADPPHNPGPKPQISPFDTKNAGPDSFFPISSVLPSTGGRTTTTQKTSYSGCVRTPAAGRGAVQKFATKKLRPSATPCNNPIIADNPIIRSPSSTAAAAADTPGIVGGSPLVGSRFRPEGGRGDGGTIGGW